MVAAAVCANMRLCRRRDRFTVSFRERSSAATSAYAGGARRPRDQAAADETRRGRVFARADATRRRWSLRAPLFELAGERGISDWELYEAADGLVEFARLPEFGSRTVWRLTGETLEWLHEIEEQGEQEEEPGPQSDAEARFVRAVDAYLEGEEDEAE